VQSRHEYPARTLLILIYSSIKPHASWPIIAGKQFYLTQRRVRFRVCLGFIVLLSSVAPLILFIYF
jgi:hypothetical protein